MEIIYNPIGLIHTPFKEIEGMPIQPIAAAGTKGKIEIFKAFEEGLQDLVGFSHIILIYHFHLSEGYSLKITPFLDNVPRGLFSTRAPKRPNPIGISVVKLNSIKNNVVLVENVDILDGTPILDIKPFVSEFDNVKNERIGWLSENINKKHNKTSDERFV
jgi:tRNA-Thr(GGU) m(6)t(6)A37 methyltransferase TsaA